MPRERFTAITGGSTVGCWEREKRVEGVRVDISLSRERWAERVEESLSKPGREGGEDEWEEDEGED